MRLFLFILLIYYIIFNTQIVSAFSDNFEDGDISDWYIKTGSWSVGGDYTNKYLTVDTSSVAKINHSIPLNTDYLKFDFMRVSGSATNFFADINSNDTTDCTRACGGSLLINTNSAGTVAVLHESTYVLTMTTTISSGSWYRLSIQTFSETSSITVKIYYLNDTLIESKSASYSVATNNKWLIFSKDSPNMVFRIDNITTVGGFTPTPTPTTTYTNTYIPSSNFTLIGIDFSSCGWGDVICGLGVLYNSFWNLLYTIFDYFYYLLYSIFAIPVGIITSILNGFILIFTDLYGIITDISNLMNNIYNFLNYTVKLLYYNAWITIILTGFSLVVGFRIYGLVRGSKT